ncbi:hypothetical protein [Streptomyces sp. NPDC058486]|uniref:hypothetical protein n=1 Tax=unclassified Streptomyces TaxID=2593676 RepID=UPI0036587359
MNGFESRRWDDESYSQVLFTGCDQGFATSVDVTLWEDVSLNYDNNKGSSTFLNCFTGSDKVSSKSWTGLPANDFYFKLGSLKGENKMWARTVEVDTTAAD